MPSPVLLSYLQGKQDKRQKLQDIATSKRTSETHDIGMQTKRMDLKERGLEISRGEEDRKIAQSKAVDDIITKAILSADPDNLKATMNPAFQNAERIISANYPDRKIPNGVLAHIKKTYDAANNPEAIRAIQATNKKKKEGDSVYMTSGDGKYEVQVPWGSPLSKRLMVDKWTIGKKVKTDKDDKGYQVKPADIQKQTEYEDGVFRGKLDTKSGEYVGGIKPGQKLSPRTLKNINNQRKAIGMPVLVESKATEEQKVKHWYLPESMEGTEKLDIYAYTEKGNDTPVNASTEKEPTEAAPTTLTEKQVKSQFPDARQDKSGVWWVEQDGKWLKVGAQ